MYYMKLIQRAITYNLDSLLEGKLSEKHVGLLQYNALSLTGRRSVKCCANTTCPLEPYNNTLWCVTTTCIDVIRNVVVYTKLIVDH